MGWLAETGPHLGEEHPCAGPWPQRVACNRLATPPHSEASVATEKQGDALSSADAERDQPSRIATLHLGKDLGRDRGAGGADRVAERDRTAVGVDLLLVEAESSMTARACAAKASLSSMTWTSFSDRPARSSTLARLGPARSP